MSWTLNKILTVNEYTEANTLLGGMSKRALVIVQAKPVLLQALCDPEGERVGSPSIGAARWMAEAELPPGAWPILRKGLFGIRVRSANEGFPAEVIIELIGVND